ncbi:phospholipase A2 inhibitor and Ly6/PLAUR domain-containing protein-like [Hippoglossus hippoglossus]|uniref:phospholipase A2 inhibitor and Ly6/PLAUR domain-containing protein-like n=1 Tax=Hippoglossus hippoglossus TaxID=8267 RepID=UPI00148C6E23|nr:phospholipase A2 inhibitor and Ly6/PLAUR domain-containing protein-like [Hippoglossus hippoglossus]
MKLLLSLTLFWALSSTGGALLCQTCTNPSCSTTVPLTCSSGMCITASIQGQQIYKACAPSSLCPATGSQTFSFNLGVLSVLASAKCCNTDNCNSANLPAPAAVSANGLQCFFCNPITSQCNSLVQCKGTEDRCFEASAVRDAAWWFSAGRELQRVVAATQKAQESKPVFEDRSLLSGV